ncbi:Dot/Icm T4SS effector Zinc-dependent metalloprotease LegP [Legionella jordanis]|uniref:Metalloproteinase-like protein n=1 Tax=Legionella jordanis TaxID=456 RepID=A0A0W0VCM7_9GAMM|nr:Dot/Icm T4SS effector Zinc-dependent metalloprotease LegP [Legionella jordanis]KTD17883.1 metalloproteinase-like protein [Legionella jordanis]RMX02417.1 peptidase [Legionella jordanis]RMX21740.1 peptidase [Legionella jordanis]VEH14026.1 astacin protease [Legionella jordanis]HAT8713854.1 peptidase [Legionella jordanis]
MPKRLFAFFLLSLFHTVGSAQTLKQVLIADPVWGKRPVLYEEQNGFAVSEGDIILAKVAELSRRSAIVITLNMGGGRWTNALVPYEISEDLPFMNKLAILQAIAHWQDKTAIRFVELTSKNRHQYSDYISFIPAPGTTCSSYVGKQGGKQEINLSPRCNTMNTVHEIGHALGLWHEQSRADRSNYIRILWENIEEDHQYNFDQHLTDGSDFGEYDYQSIMHYGPYAFSKNGERTIIPLAEGVQIGQRERLSEKDIAAIKAMYPEA